MFGKGPGLEEWQIHFRLWSGSECCIFQITDYADNFPRIGITQLDSFADWIVVWKMRSNHRFVNDGNAVGTFIVREGSALLECNPHQFEVIRSDRTQRHGNLIFESLQRWPSFDFEIRRPFVSGQWKAPDERRAAYARERRNVG